MITEAFDNKSPAILTLDKLYGEKRCKRYRTAIVTFSERVYEEVSACYEREYYDYLRSINGPVDVKGIKLGEYTSVGFYKTWMGSALCATGLVEVNHLIGATNFIIFGTAGSLDTKAVDGKVIVPDYAYRDEGLSYHYAEPGDFIKIKNAEIVKEYLDKVGIENCMAKTWTTDAILMETENKVKKVKDLGCKCVEMEIAGCQAVCDYYGFNLYPFLMTSDKLDGKEYERGKGKSRDISSNLFEIAKNFAIYLEGLN